jgi:hypothetical protein
LKDEQIAELRAELKRLGEYADKVFLRAVKAEADNVALREGIRRSRIHSNPQIRGRILSELLASPSPGAGILSVVEAAEDFALVWSNPDLVADYDRVAGKVVRAVRARRGNLSVNY